jgi:hypothetical protein
MSTEHHNASNPATSAANSGAYRELAEGTVVELKSGAVAEVIGNPGDGAWLLVRITESPEAPNEVGSEELVFFTDVQGAR